MLSETAVFRPRSDVRFRVVGDEAVIVRQEQAEVIAVNEVGASVLSLLDARRSVRDLLEALLEEYDVDRESLASDVSRFLAELREAGVVVQALATRRRSTAPGTRTSCSPPWWSSPTAATWTVFSATTTSAGRGSR
jgi:hypothetical protein